MSFVKNTAAALSVAASCFAVVGASGNSTNTTIPTNSTIAPTIVNSTTCNGKAYVYQELAGYGFVKSDAVDKYNNTIGGIGSSIAIDLTTWTHQDGGNYTGILWALPDRGYNTEGTLNYQNRVHEFNLTLTPNASASATNPSPPNLFLDYMDTVLFSDPGGKPTSGIDADAHGPYLGIMQNVPAATIKGDGFGHSGAGSHQVSLDSEGLALAADGSFWVSDEYGPYIYRFNKHGLMDYAIRPPNAFIPQRDGSDSFSADSPPFYNLSAVPSPANNPSGRDNNQGFEGLTLNSNGTMLYTLVQSALNPEGGLSNQNRRYARLLAYNISSLAAPAVYVAEYVVPLPLYPDGSKVATQSEIHYISDTQFLILARDSNSGRGQASTQSVYRHADIFDISKASNVKSNSTDDYNGTIASSTGVLNSGITPAQYCSFLDFNINSELNKFGVHNGGAQDDGLLNEKWESLALVPVHDTGADGEFFLFSLSDNDFITQNGTLEDGDFTYKDPSGYSLLNQALAFKVTIPKGGPAPY